MKLVRLRYFVAVVEERSFTRAAAKLRIAQPALSRQIRTLENEVGVELLVRDGRAFKLTPAGEVLSEEGAIILAHYALATQRAREAGNRDSVVRVGIGFGLGEHVGRVVTRHAGSFADIHIQLQTIPSTAQNLALKGVRLISVFCARPSTQDTLAVTFCSMSSSPLWCRPYLHSRGTKLSGYRNSQTLPYCFRREAFPADSTIVSSICTGCAPLPPW